MPTFIKICQVLSEKKMFEEKFTDDVYDNDNRRQVIAKAHIGS